MDPILAAEFTETVVETHSMWTKIFSPQWTNMVAMIPLLCCSILTAAIIVDRLWKLRKKNIFPDGLTDEVEAWLRKGDIESALEKTKSGKSLLHNVLTASLEDVHVRKIKPDVGFIQNVGYRLSSLTKNLDTLGTISRVAPLLGLLGTVLGMIESFTVIAAFEEPPKDAVAEGIATALLTTAAGLIVAIPALVAESYFARKGEEYFLKFSETMQQMLSSFTSDPEPEPETDTETSSSDDASESEE